MVASYQPKVNNGTTKQDVKQAQSQQSKHQDNINDVTMVYSLQTKST